MRAVWSFWSKPHNQFYHCNWLSERAHRLCWILSISEGSRHYKDTCLFTDDAGAELLIDRLQLPFRHVRTDLESLNRDGSDPEWWVLSKLSTYATQTEPFVHLDADVILWKALSQQLAAAAVIAQNPEHFEFSDQSLYRADRFIRGITDLGGWLPGTWWRYAKRSRNAALCCGILGGTDTAFLRRYAHQAIDIIRHPRNGVVWERLGIRDNILVEQYFLAACLEDPTVGGSQAQYLFPSSTHAFDAAQAERAGYTHLIGNAKADPEIAARLEARVRAHYPALYERCINSLGETTQA